MSDIEKMMADILTDYSGEAESAPKVESPASSKAQTSINPKSEK